MLSQKYDNFYFLAKKYGFRSRAAFKLIEINKKYKFLENSTGIIDLCAAPGSWSQVAKKIAPNGSLILGIDAQSIRPIKNCYFLRGDITSPGIIKAISKIKKIDNRKINIILHDGAPKIGGSWLKDALNQNEMVLSALKIGVHCLEKGGCLISKVFRSEFLHGILYISRCFFEKVRLFKPLSSRLSSTEIFLICKNFKAPKIVDSFFFSSNYIFGFAQKILEEKINSSQKKNQNTLSSEINFLEPNKNPIKKYTGVYDSYRIDEEFESIFGITFFSKIFSEKFIQFNFKKEKFFWEQLFRKWCCLFLENIIFKHI